MPGVIYGPNGKPFTDEQLKAFSAGDKAPVMGESFGPWAGRDMQYVNLPGGGVVQFDLSRLTLSDYRMMTSHYQVNSSLLVLTFMLHQLEWHVEAADPKVAAHVEENLANIWTRLVRAMSQSFWAGYSPNILQWENDLQGNTIQLTKIKDLAPEEATVNWKEVEGNAPPGYSSTVKPKIKVFDGIKQFGVPYPVPVSNSFWYPLLMENGNYAGRKLLKSAFTPWFFSTLIHLFSNRYFERFGEPVPIGRAPLGESITVDGKEVTSTDYMAGIVNSIRSRATVILPSDRDPNVTSGNNNFDYNIEYLESQMRGADFERYLTRLDEEISLALFTPILLVRTADVGSYNLGNTHMQMYQWQLNAIAGDWAEYINKYIVAPMAVYNFGEDVKLPKVVFHKMGKTQEETTRAVLTQLVKDGAVKIDLFELGQATGLELSEVETIVSEGATTTDAPDDEADHGSVNAGAVNTDLATKIVARVAPQAARAASKGVFGAGWEPDLGSSAQLPSEKRSAIQMWTRETLEAGNFTDQKDFISKFEVAVKSFME